MSNKDLICYIPTSVEKELPKGESAIWMQPIGDKLKRFRELSLPELMEGFGTWLRKNQWHGNSSGEWKRAVALNEKPVTIEYLTKQFLKTKGIL